MRLVVDTNVFISAALKADSAPRHAFRWMERNAAFLKSVQTEDELYRTLSKPALAALLGGADFIGRLTQIMRTAERVEIVDRIRACRDPDDDKFLELAVNGRADAIISGDTDLLAMHPFRDIPILAPAAFIRGIGVERE